MTLLSSPRSTLSGVVLVALMVVGFIACSAYSAGITLPLAHDWQLQSSANLPNHGDGAQISRVGYSTSAWVAPISVPATIVAALVQAGKIVDPYYSKNLADVDSKQFDVPWWYRCSFRVNHSSTGTPWTYGGLRFKGINYRANVWLNGQLIAQQKDTMGAFRYFQFDITSKLSYTTENVLAVEIFKPNDYSFPPDNNSTDLAITFVDWSPAPPDNSMGIWREVEVLLRDGPVTLDAPSVETTLYNNNNKARLDVLVEATNHGTKAVTGDIIAHLSIGALVKQTVTLLPGEQRLVVLNHTQHSALDVNNPRLWWPWQMGKANLYNLSIVFTPHGQPLSDSVQARFGVRQVTSEITKTGARLFLINGKPLLIRGAGWAPDLFLRESPVRTAQEFEYVRQMGLNTIRLEGKMPPRFFFDLADEMGLLIMPGWCCCDAWQHWNAWGPEQMLVAKESMHTQARRLRIHPSIFVFLYGSDESPPLHVEELFLAALVAEKWPNPTLASAADTKSSVSGPTGVKMSGPYAWVPPIYWQNMKLGGAFGFLTEGGPGASPMTLESLARTIPADKMWPMNDYWNWHCGNQLGEFGSLKWFTPPLLARYGTAKSAADYLYKSQVQAYEAQRSMFEAYNRNKYSLSTGLIQWMLNNPFPEMIWNMYDYYLNPGGSFFGAKKANEDLHIQYTYSDKSIWLVNSIFTTVPAEHTATATFYNLQGGKFYTHSVNVTAAIPPDSSRHLFTLPAVHQANITGKSYMLRLELVKGKSEVISKNTYWLSIEEDKLVYENSTFFITPCSSYADFTDLQRLPPVKLEAKLEHVATETTSAKRKSIVTVRNPDKDIAFFVRVRLVKGPKTEMTTVLPHAADLEDVLPIAWSDNFFTLLPGESERVEAEYEWTNADSWTPHLDVQVWNNNRVV